MLKVIGGEQEGEFKAVASGTLPNGKPVIVNSDGTVSVAKETSVSSSVGTDTNFNNSNTIQTSAAYDSTNNKVVLVYRDYLTTNYGMAIVGTVSGSSISFGTEVTFNTGVPNYAIARFDESTGKVVIVFGDGSNSNYGTAIVGTVSGTSISFGSKVVFNSAEAQSFGLCYESTAQKMVISYRDEGDTNNGNAIVGTVSGTSISFGSEATFDTDNIADTRLAYDSNAGKVVVAYRNGTQGNLGYAAVGTVTGTSISFGTRVLFNGGTGVTSNIDIAYDENAQKVVIAYKDGPNSDAGSAIVGTVSGTSISFGTEAVFSVGTPEYISVVYHAAAKKVVITYEDTGNSQYGTAKACNISGTSLTFDDAIIFKDAEMNWTAATYDSTTEQVVVAYRDNDNSNNGYAVVLQIAYTATNLTAENYIGMSRGVTLVVDTSVGSTNLFNAASTNNVSSVYDANAEKTVFFYTDEGNSSYGTAIVADSTGSTLSYGSEAVFETANASAISCAYDSSNNKVVVAYRDNGNLNRGTACVGTVSGTSITFGTPVTFTTNQVGATAATFDSSNNKIVIHYRDNDNSAYPTAVVGTVSGTSISFGTPVVAESAATQYQGATFDSTNNKVILSYNAYTLNRSKAAVGTVSGTSISFGTAVEFWAAGSEYPVVTFDSTNSKVVFAFSRAGTYTGTCVVGTVSGTTMTFGTAVVFDDSQTDAPMDITFDSNADKIVIAYKDKGNSNKGTYAIGSVSGTDITFEDPLVFSSGNQSWPRVSFDSSTNKVVTAYRDTANSDQGTGVILQVGYENRYPVADGNPASLDIIGSVSTNQSGLTAGSKYYVQSDGTISTTSSSVLAGTAISATKLLVKT